MVKLVLCLLLLVQAPGEVRNTWPKEYTKRDAASFAAAFEEPSRALFRYRAAMTGLMQVKPGMKVGEVGAGSGAMSRFLAEKVGPDGHVYANELEDKMLTYMRERAAKEGIRNLTVVKGTPTSTGFEPGSLDALAVVYTFSFFDKPAEMLQSMHASLKPGGVMLIVDIPSEQVGSTTVGADADAVIALASQHGFTRAGENGVVPGHYALIFRKQ
jgi:ubiquinone/menaquinone biosynthesis C-methylase UbiE